ncbi:class B sortase [Novisyntrophococcus fermenticellae]|uniref:class B sortase n=1 Tax=Novisyntrophococcus fermenticellae TaxID=2068655 RepID=UPI001E37D832|nr:class B sortase [Novisyntrophococcus fermenticellae]
MRTIGLKTAAVIARAGNKVLSFAAAVMILLLLLYGGYSLWDTVMVYKGAFADDELMRFKPSDNSGNNPTLDELRKINPDVCGWITIQDTNIDYPVVQGKTDMEYINKDVYGEFSLSGSVFLDSRNQPDFSDSYSLVYGHHMANGAMFGDIVKFVNNSYFVKHKTGTLYLPDDTYTINLFACMKTDAFDSRIFYPDSQNRENLNEFLEYIRIGAVQYRETDVKAGDSLIGLSTCSEAETNGRVVVFGWLKR